MKTDKMDLSPKQRDELLAALKARFDENQDLPAAARPAPGRLRIYERAARGDAARAQGTCKAGRASGRRQRTQTENLTRTS